MAVAATPNACSSFATVSLATRQVVPSTQMTASARGLLPWLAERDAVLRGLMGEGRSERMSRLARRVL